MTVVSYGGLSLDDSVDYYISVADLETPNSIALRDAPEGVHLTLLGGYFLLLGGSMAFNTYGFTPKNFDFRVVHNGDGTFCLAYQSSQGVVYVANPDLSLPPVVPGAATAPVDDKYILAKNTSNKSAAARFGAYAAGTVQGRQAAMLRLQGSGDSPNRCGVTQYLDLSDPRTPSPLPDSGHSSGGKQTFYYYAVTAKLQPIKDERAAPNAPGLGYITKNENGKFFYSNKTRFRFVFSTAWPV